MRCGYERKGGNPSNLLVSREFLKRKNIDFVTVERGGDITYHGPGQIVVYPVLNLHAGKLGVAGYVERLENIMIATARDYHVHAERNSVNRGVYVGKKKLGSVGVSVQRGITFHGLALNVNVSLEPFSWIHPCGFQDLTMTTLESESPTDVSMADVMVRIKQHTAEQLSVTPEYIDFEDFQKEYTKSPNATSRDRVEIKKPGWLKQRIPNGAEHEKIRALIKGCKLNTVCQEAKCPNLFECFSNHTATFLILGNRCTRNCRFCAIETGPHTPPDPEEPLRVAQSAKTMQLKYVVVTSVTRDDVSDGGAGIFSDTIGELRKHIPNVKVETLIPDFNGNIEALETVLAAGPDVLNHNVETVPRLYSSVRPEAVYLRSLKIFEHAAAYAPSIFLKSGMMLGLGETASEVEQVLRDLFSAGCRMLTLGQYLQPTKSHLEVHRFIPPEEFAGWRERALEIGFLSVASGPFVRSSYQAEKMLFSSCP